MINPVIVIVAYNRPSSLKRLLSSLNSANYPKTTVDLIISIDKGKNNQDVLDMANGFEWRFGEKKIKYQTKNLGLKNHIISCMKYVYDYEQLIMLEDDLYVSPHFYTYTLEALKFTEGNNRIAGISLYNHRYNVHVSRNFEFISDFSDNWYFQFASSWGQVWCRNHIESFLKWYSTECNFEKNENIPLYVRSWPEKSWLKHFIAYTILEDKYFFYPSISLTTNFGDSGSNMTTNSTTFQVPLQMGDKAHYVFSHLDESMAVYDSFFENRKLANALNLNEDMLTVDLYGYRTYSNRKYLLTTKKLNFKTIQSFGKELRPHDLNVIHGILGDDIFLYDTEHYVKNKTKETKWQELIYEYRNVQLNEALILSYNRISERIKSGFKKVFKI